MVDGNGRQTITNDGATVMKVRLETHPHIFPSEDSRQYLFIFYFTS